MRWILANFRYFLKYHNQLQVSVTIFFQDMIESNWLQVVTSIFRNVLPDKIQNYWLHFFSVLFFTSQYLPLSRYHFFCSYVLETSHKAVNTALEVNLRNWTLQRNLHGSLCEALSFRAPMDLNSVIPKYSTVK